MHVRPLGHRIVVRPDSPVTASEGGIFIPETYQDVPAMSGIVERVGDGAERDTRIRTRTIARCMAILDDAEVEAGTPSEAIALAKDELARYLRDAGEIGHVCEVGQRVIFPMEAGHEIVIGEDTENALVIVSEDSLLAVYDAEEQAA